MNIISVNTGIPKSYTLDDVTIKTSMVRSPQKQIDVKFNQILGDEFTSPKIHGVPEAVVYAFSIDRYEYWSEYLGKKVGIGLFGENLSIDHLREENFCLGDEYEAGTTLLRVTGPRYPCNRLNYVSGNKTTQKHFADTAWPGVYFQVINEGIIKPLDKLVFKKRVQDQITVTDLFLSLRSLERQEPVNDKIKQIMNSAHVLEKYANRLERYYGKAHQ